MSWAEPGAGFDRRLTLAALVLCACARSQGEPAAAAVEMEAFSQTYAETVCEIMDRCCRQAGWNGAASSCVEIQAMTPGHSGPAERYRPDVAAVCLAALKDLTCGPFDKYSYAPFPRECGEVYDRGSLELGDTCESFLDCAEPPGRSVDCVLQSDGTRQCQEWIEREEGESCADASCTFGLFCDPDTELCSPPARLGEPCVTGPVWGDTCEVGAVCDRLGTRTCIRPVALGEPCSEIEECEALMCIEGVCQPPYYGLVFPGCAP